jgi:magnesium transporter
MIEKLAVPVIHELIAENDRATLADVLNQWSPATLAGLITELGDDEDRAKLLQVLDDDHAGRTFGHLDLSTRARLIDAFSENETARLIDGMAPDDRTALLARLPAESSDRLLSLLSPEQRTVAERLLQYGPATIGRLMTPDYVALRPEWTIGQAFDHVRAVGKHSETLNVVYVVDDAGKLIDDIRLGDLILASVVAHVRDIMNCHFIALKAEDEAKTTVEMFRRYGRSVLPVVDAAGTLVGIVTIDDVLDVAEERATRELQRFGGLEALEDSYVQTPLLEMVRRRASWLVILFLGEMLTATAMGYFEKEIEKAVVLALFVPLIISSGGNSGSQAATLIIRALALGELTLQGWWSVMRREILSGLMLGGILGAIGFCRIAAWSAFSTIYGPHWALVGLTVALSLVGIVLLGTISGSMLPFLLKSLGLDPATSSAPFVATLVDVTGLVIYFSVAYVVLRGTLL